MIFSQDKRGRCENCKWRDASGCPSRTGEGCDAWESDFERPRVIGKIKVLDEQIREALR